MAINYEYEIDGKILRVTTSGRDDNLEEVIAYARDILGIAVKYKSAKVFCDERRLEYSLSIIDTFQLAETASREAKLLKKIVIVCDEKYLESGSFFEDVAINRGLKIFVTSDFEKAQEWLKEESN